jgi:hypothetical protein
VTRLHATSPSSAEGIRPKNDMRTVLLLAYSYPPNGNMAGQRPAAFARYLPELGWRPLVICADWNAQNCRTYDAASLTEPLEAAVFARGPAEAQKASPSIGGRVAGYAKLILQGGRFPRHWTSFACRAGRRALAANRVDAIWASFAPAGAHFAARELHADFGIPWVADFRDTWDKQRRIWRWLMLRQEIALSRSAAAITTVSPGLVDFLAARHLQPIFLVPNGYNPEELRERVAPDSRSFRIVYTGSLTPRLQDPAPLFCALDKLANESVLDLSEVSIDFYGTTPRALSGLQHYASFSRARLIPWVPRGQAVRAQQEASILLHLSSAESKGIMTGKVFEYLAARRPILTIPGDRDCVDALLQETRGGVSLQDVEVIAGQIKRWYREWKESGAVNWEGNWERVAQYSRRAQTAQLAKILDHVSRSSSLRSAGHFGSKARRETR